MFGKSLTFQEIREHLIASYNEPPSFESLKLLNDSKSFINSQVEKDYVIDGITHIMRFNSKKLQQFCNPNQKAWHEVALTEELKKPSKKGVIENISSDNLKEDELSFSDLPGELKPYSTISKQFVHSLQEGKSMGLIFSGVDKIEESKLGAILAVTAAQYGHDVLYIDIKNILELLKSKVLSTEKEALIRDVIFKKSLIVLNGSPWNSPDAQFVLNYIVNNVLDKNQSLVLCSNYPLPLLSQMRCPPVRYDDPVTNAFLQITPTKQPIHESSSILFPKTTLQSNPQEKVNNELLKFLGVGDEKGIKKILSIAEETGIKDFVKQGASLEILIPSTDKTVLEYLKSLGKDQLVSELDEIIKKYKM
jgi:DNA replication protein DnaC